MQKLVSPNDLQLAAQNMMLDGREPISRKDWAMCANFWAANIAKGLEVTALPLLGLLFNCPLTKDELIAIANYQRSRK